jgi:hypothetical protein
MRPSHNHSICPRIVSSYISINRSQLSYLILHSHFTKLLKINIFQCISPETPLVYLENMTERLQVAYFYHQLQNINDQMSWFA